MHAVFYFHDAKTNDNDKNIMTLDISYQFNVSLLAMNDDWAGSSSVAFIYLPENKIQTKMQA